MLKQRNDPDFRYAGMRREPQLHVTQLARCS
jgi:hypothetical protein